MVKIIKSDTVQRMLAFISTTFTKNKYKLALIIVAEAFVLSAYHAIMINIYSARTIFAFCSCCLLPALLTCCCFFIKPTLLPKKVWYSRNYIFQIFFAVFLYVIITLLIYYFFASYVVIDKSFAFLKAFIVLLGTPLILRILETRPLGCFKLLLSRWTLQQLIKPLHLLCALAGSLIIGLPETMLRHYYLVHNLHAHPSLCINILLWVGLCCVYLVVCFVVSCVCAIVYISNR